MRSTPWQVLVAEHAVFVGLGSGHAWLADLLLIFAAVAPGCTRIVECLNECLTPALCMPDTCTMKVTFVENLGLGE